MANSGSILAFDLGGTRIKAGSFTASDELDRIEVADVPEGGHEAALGALVRLGEALDADPSGVGLCVPGLVDDDGIITALPGKLEGIVGFDLRGFLRDRFGTDSVICNDAVAYGVGEATAGAGADAGRVVVMTIGTGVGVAVIDRGRPVTTGRLGGGILGGFIPIAEDDVGPTDTDGGHGTIEALCMAQRIVDYANVKGNRFANVPEVYAAYQGQDADAVAGMRGYQRQLVRAIVALANAHAPDVVVVGGGPITQRSPVLDGVQDAVNRRLWESFDIEVRPAALGDTAALTGLAHLWRTR